VGYVGSGKSGCGYPPLFYVLPVDDNNADVAVQASLQLALPSGTLPFTSTTATVFTSSFASDIASGLGVPTTRLSSITLSTASSTAVFTTTSTGDNDNGMVMTPQTSVDSDPITITWLFTIRSSSSLINGTYIEPTAMLIAIKLATILSYSNDVNGSIMDAGTTTQYYILGSYEIESAPKTKGNCATLPPLLCNTNNAHIALCCVSVSVMSNS
jgi:hypothetical protein